MNHSDSDAEGAVLSGVMSVLAAPALVVDDDGRVVDVNQEAADLIGRDVPALLGRRIGEVLHCANLSPEHPECGTTPRCGECSLRQAICGSLGPGAMNSRAVSLRRKAPDHHGHVMLIVDAAALFYGDCVGSCAGCGRVSGVTPCHCTTEPGGQRCAKPGTHWCITWGDFPSA